MGDERLSKKREIANWPQEKKKITIDFPECPCAHTHGKHP